MINVVIPTKTDEYLDTLLSSLISANSYQFLEYNDGHQIVVGDNGLSKPCRNSYGRIRFVDIENPFIFSKAINKCIERTDVYSDIMIFNDDVEIVSRKLFDKVERLLEDPDFKDYGLISLHILPGGAGNKDQCNEVPEDSIIETRNPVCFIAAVIRRDVWNTVGKLDERFTGYGFEDTDYSRRVVEAGWKLGVTGAGSVRHKSSGTFKPMYGPSKHREMFYEAERIFIDKWGEGPQLGRYGGPVVPSRPQ